MKLVPNKVTGEDVQNGYKSVRAQYIDFVKKYNTSNTAGSISLNPVELKAMNELHVMWKNASLQKTERCGNHFFDMKELHEKLDSKFPKSSEECVSMAWNSYVKGHSDLLQLILASSATQWQIRV